MTTTGNILSMACLQWTIPDYFTKVNDVPQRSFIASPTFEFYDCTWKIKLYPKSVEKYIELCLEMLNSDTEKKMCFTLKLKNSTTVREAYHVFGEKNGFDWRFRKFITIDELKDEKNNFVTSGRVSVICCMAEWEPSSVTEKMEPRLKLRDVGNLSLDFEDLYVNKKMCDVLVKVQEREYQALRAVLVARSSVFAAMFEHDLKEKDSGVVTVPDCDPDTFEEFLQFLYTGRMEEISFRTARHLYVTADKYDIPELKSYCLENMTRLLTSENVCDAVRLAEQYDETSLKSEVQTFFNRSTLSVVSTVEWDQLSKTDYRLAKKLLMEALRCNSKCSEE